MIFTMGLPIVLVMLGPPFGWATRLFGLLLLGPLLLATYYTGSRGGLLLRRWPSSALLPSASESQQRAWPLWRR